MCKQKTQYNGEGQVSASAYNFLRYMRLPRWVSTHSQVREVLSRNPDSVLEVGKGLGVFAYLIKQAGVKYTSVDVASDLGPDVVASVTELPFSDNSFDIAVAFQVLEHMPYEDFTVSVQELVRVARRYVIISLPHYGPNLQLSWKIPGVRHMQLACRLPFPKKHEFDGQHFWEIGKKDYPLRRIVGDIQQYAELEHTFVLYENRAHRFFVLNVNKLK